MQVFIYIKFTPHVSGVHRTHHEYIKLYLEPLGTGHITYQCNDLPPWPKAGIYLPQIYSTCFGCPSHP